MSESKLFNCLLCQQPPSAFGEFLETSKYGFHYLCLLLSPALYQKDNEENGFYGFLSKDVLLEERRITKQRCYFCKKPHANFSCSVAACRYSFHVDCGLNNDCQYNMLEFQTHCHKHRKFKPKKPKKEEICIICGEAMGQYKPNKSIFSDCCKESFYHRTCLQKMADSAGYFFCCPLCKNEEEFSELVQEQGIFVPQRDASWELEPNAFAEQLIRPDTCSAVRCKCLKGRKFKNDEDWQMVFCAACGGECRHQVCLKDLRYFICDTCTSMNANELLVDCLVIESLDPTDSDLEDFEEALKAFPPIKKFFAGDWIDRIESTDLKFLPIVRLKRIEDETPQQYSKNREPQTIKRLLVSPSHVELSLFEPPRKKFKTEKEYSRTNTLLRRAFLEPHLDNSNETLSDSSLVENRPPSISPNRRHVKKESGLKLKQTTIYSFFLQNRNSS